MLATVSWLMSEGEERWFFLHDPVAAPEDGVAVEVLRGVEPEAVALLPAGRRAAVAVHVGLQSPLVPPPVAKELKVELVVVLVEDVAVGQLRIIALIVMIRYPFRLH